MPPNDTVSVPGLQVASHAQKYFIRLNSMNKKDKRRSSIHDITSVNPPSGDMTGWLYNLGLLPMNAHAAVLGFWCPFFVHFAHVEYHRILSVPCLLSQQCDSHTVQSLHLSD